jgi:hypothetical protein
MGTLIFLFLLYVASVFVVAEVTTHNRGDFWLMVMLNIAFSPIIGAIFALIFLRNSGRRSSKTDVSTSAAIGAIMACN